MKHSLQGGKSVKQLWAVVQIRGESNLSIGDSSDDGEEEIYEAFGGRI